MSNVNTVSTLQDLIDHANGLSRRHDADSLNLTTPILIDGDTVTTVEEAIQKLSELALPPEIQDATGSVKGIIKLSGDLGGTSAEPSVSRIRGREVSNENPTDGDVLTWLDNSWQPLPPSTSIPNASVSVFGKVRLSDGVTTAGDIGGTAGNLSIIKLQDYNLTIGGSGNPAYNGQFLKWDGYSWSNSYLPEADGYNFGTVRLSGDVALNSSSGQIKVTGLQTYPVYLPCEPYEKDLLTWSSADGYWTSKSLNAATSSSIGGINLKADLGGTAFEPKVVGWSYKKLGYEFDNPQRYDIPIYNAPETLFGFDIDPSEDERWTLVNLQEIIDDVTFTPSRDLSGTKSSQTVVGLYNIDIDPSAADPAIGDVLMYQQVFVPAFDLEPTVGKWVPTQLNPSDFFSPAGDLSGTNFSQSVVGWKGKDLSTSFSSPINGDFPIYDSSASSWSLANFYSALESYFNENAYEPGNPEVREYYQQNVRNKCYKYIGSEQSVNTVRGTFIEYSIQDNSTIFISGKIIGRVVQNNEPDIIIPLSTAFSTEMDGYVDLTPSAPMIDKLGFDLDSSVYPGYSVVFDIQASYVKNDGYVSAMYTTDQNLYGELFDTGVSNNIIAAISEYPIGIREAFYYPVIQFIDNNTIQIATGYSTNATINWTIDLEVRENGI